MNLKDVNRTNGVLSTIARQQNQHEIQKIPMNNRVYDTELAGADFFI